MYNKEEIKQQRKNKKSYRSPKEIYDKIRSEKDPKIICDRNERKIKKLNL